MIDTFIRIIANAACFFELADESALDSRVALRQLEAMKWELQKLTAADKVRVAETILQLAQQCGTAPRDTARRQCLENLPRALGLLEAEE